MPQSALSLVIFSHSVTFADAMQRVASHAPKFAMLSEVQLRTPHVYRANATASLTTLPMLVCDARFWQRWAREALAVRCCCTAQSEKEAIYNRFVKKLREIQEKRLRDLLRSLRDKGTPPASSLLPRLQALSSLHARLHRQAPRAPSSDLTACTLRRVCAR